MRVEASAPSNIALIKYMGKTAGNVPTNASLSYTLEHLRTFVTLEPGPEQWLPLEGFAPLALSDSGKKKYLAHFQRLKEQWKISGTYTVKSANNFPSDCGLASSASSFAALTRATAQLRQTLGGEWKIDPAELSCLSRRGSGSSCRSMFSPWALWRAEGAEAIDLPNNLEHAVILVESEKKAVSSSEAHLRVSSSLLFKGRAERAELRLSQLTAALRDQQWAAAFELCWSEFWDMHALFESSVPGFGYMTEESLRALRHFRQIWQAAGDGPLVTMDAGANIHLLLRRDQLARADRWVEGWHSLKSWG